MPKVYTKKIYELLPAKPATLPVTVPVIFLKMAAHILILK